MRKMGFVVPSPSQTPPQALSSDLGLKNKHPLGISPSLPNNLPQEQRLSLWWLMQSTDFAKGAQDPSD